MNYTSCDKIAELTTLPMSDVRKILCINQLDNLVHELFPMTFAMKYEVVAKPGIYNADVKRYFFEAESDEDVTDMTGIFSLVLKECKITTFNSSIEWDDEQGYRIWFSLHLSYKHFEGGTNGMAIADFIFENGTWRKNCYKGQETED